MEDNLVTVARFDDNIEADLAKQLLEDFGIKAVVMGQDVANVFAGVPGVIDLELQTLESQAKQAVEILESKEREEQ